MTLTIQDLGALGELLGAIAVLATLIYLALQTRQNTMAIGAQLDAALISATQDLTLALSTSTELLEALVEDSTTDETTNAMRRRFYFASRLNNWQWQYLQARRGLLPGFNEAGLAAAIVNSFRVQRSFEDFWGRMKANMRPEFVEFVEEQRSKAA